MSTNRLRINEIFHSVQGEGTRIGRRCAFVRLTGCHLRCTWCDTEYAFYEGGWMSLAQIHAELAAFDCPLVQITGGEPLLQPAVYPLMSELADRGHEVLLETSGAMLLDRVDPRVARIMDLKCPGSGEVERNDWGNVELLTDRDEVKFVIADRADYEWARDALRRYTLSERCAAVLFSPVHGTLPPVELTNWVLADRLPVRLGVQLHKVIWSPETRGV